MATAKKPAFPQTPNGVTDWEKVFEDSESGLIPAVRMVKSREALHETVQLIIRQLFTRKDDDLQIAQLNLQVEAIFGGDSDLVPHDLAVMLLRQIKTQRIEKAEAYLRKKAKKKGKSERRQKSSRGGVQNTVYLIFKNPKYFFGAIGAMLAILGVLFVLIFSGLITPQALQPTEEELAAEEALIKATAAKAAAKEAEAKAEADMPMMEKITRVFDTPSTIVIRRVALPKAFGQKRKATQHVMPFMKLKDDGDMATVCRQFPYIVSALNVQLSSALNRHGKLDDQALAEVSSALATDLNGKLSGAPVTEIRLIKPQSHRDYAPAKCGSVPEKLSKYLH